MAKQVELPWIAEGRQYVGMAEIPGKQHNPTIQNWLRTLKAWWSDDETPWCGTFVAYCCRVAGRSVPNNWFRALAWAEAGERLTAPAYGCIAVFNRAGGGHVGASGGKQQCEQQQACHRRAPAVRLPGSIVVAPPLREPIRSSPAGQCRAGMAVPGELMQHLL